LTLNALLLGQGLAFWADEAACGASFDFLYCRLTHWTGFAWLVSDFELLCSIAPFVAVEIFFIGQPA
jgi:hypothetical protein